jgi:hypothetical protein
MKVIIKTLEKMPKHTRGKPGAGMFLYFVRGKPPSKMCFVFSINANSLRVNLAKICKSTGLQR